jgi:hypothetical protein
LTFQPAGIESLAYGRDRAEGTTAVVWLWPLRK